MLIIVTEQTQFGKMLSRTLGECGIFAYVCEPTTALFYCESKDTGGVVLDCGPKPLRAESLCHSLRAAYPDLPILMIAPSHTPLNAPADCILRRDGELLQNEFRQLLLDFCYTSCGFCPKPMTSFFLTVGSDAKSVFYMGYPLRLSNRAYLLLRCLFYRAPKAVPAHDLLEICYPEGADARNLAVQIHHVNRAAKAIDPRPLVVYEHGRGYRIRDGILPSPALQELLDSRQ